MPPVVKKQNPGGEPPRKPGSILDRIRQVRPKEGGLKCNFYGVGKTGKTRLACSFPKPLLLVGTEDGTGSVSTRQGVFFAKIANQEEFRILIDHCKGGKYKTIVLDTAGGLQDLILREVLNLEKVPIEKYWGLAGRDEWQAVGQQLKEALEGFLNLADRYNMNSVVIAHERNFGEDQNASGGDIVRPKVSSALSPTSSRWLDGAVDYIGQTFIREETRVHVEEVAGEKIELRQPTDKREYCLRTGAHSIYTTGFRVPDGVFLPEAIVNPSYDKIIKLIRGEGLEPKKEAPKKIPAVQGNPSPQKTEGKK